MALTNDPRDPRDDPGPYPKKSPRQPLPKSEAPPESPAASDRTLTLSEAGRAIPLAYGTVKVMGTVLELYSGLLFAGPRNAPQWQTITAYQVGDRVTANGNTYVCTQGGISAQSGTGPSGTGTGILDGHTPPPDIRVSWDFVKVGTDLYWKPSTAYTVNFNTTVVLANGNYYQCIISGTSAATGTGPSGTGPTVVDNTVTWLYIQPGWRNVMAVGYCEGQIVGAGGAWTDRGANFGSRNNTYRDNAYAFLTGEHIQLCLGTPTGIGTRPFWFPDPTAGAARDDYSNVAVLLIITVTGTDDKISNIALEVQSGTGVSTTVLDESPADIAIDLLTHTRRGAGWSTARVDTTGTLAAGVASSYRNYCTAYGLNLSWVIDTQATAMELLASLLLATNSDVVWSGGQLKFFPRGDQALTANGATYTPVTTPAYNLTSDDIIGVIEVERRSPQGAFNSYPVEYVDRAAGYVRQVVDDKDLANIDQRGLVRASTVVIPQVLSPAAAIMLSRIFTQRSLKVMNTYRFRLPYRFLLLDPCDIVTLSDSITGLSLVPVRITAIEEDQGGEGSFLIEAEDYPVAVSAAAQYTPQTGDGLFPNSGTSTGDVVIIPSATAAGTIADSTTSRGPAVHNMWPNGTSEIDQPDGSNSNAPEWAARVNAGTGALAGNWVRELTSTFSAAGSRLGDVSLGADPTNSTNTTLSLMIRTLPGELFVFTAAARFPTAPAGGTTVANIEIDFLNSSQATITTAISTTSASAGYPTAYVPLTLQSPAPPGCCFALFRLVSNPTSLVSGNNVVQFDSISVIKSNEASSDSASAAPALTVAAGSNTFTDIPGTSQSFTPITAFRRIKVSLTFSGFATALALANIPQNVRIVFGGTPTQAGVAYNLFWNTANQHQGWTFMWALAAGALGPVGTGVTVKAQIRSPVNASPFTMDGNDSVSMVIEEIG